FPPGERAGNPSPRVGAGAGAAEGPLGKRRGFAPSPGPDEGSRREFGGSPPGAAPPSRRTGDSGCPASPSGEDRGAVCRGEAGAEGPRGRGSSAPGVTRAGGEGGWQAPALGADPLSDGGRVSGYERAAAAADRYPPPPSGWKPRSGQAVGGGGSQTGDIPVSRGGRVGLRQNPEGAAGRRGAGGHPEGQLSVRSPARALCQRPFFPAHALRTGRARRLSGGGSPRAGRG